MNQSILLLEEIEQNISDGMAIIEDTPSPIYRYYWNVRIHRADSFELSNQQEQQPRKESMATDSGDDSRA